MSARALPIRVEAERSVAGLHRFDRFVAPITRSRLGESQHRSLIERRRRNQTFHELVVAVHGPRSADMERADPLAFGSSERDVVPGRRFSNLRRAFRSFVGR